MAAYYKMSSACTADELPGDSIPMDIKLLHSRHQTFEITVNPESGVHCILTINLPATPRMKDNLGLYFLMQSSTSGFGLQPLVIYSKHLFHPHCMQVFHPTSIPCSQHWRNPPSVTEARKRCCGHLGQALPSCLCNNSLNAE